MTFKKWISFAAVLVAVISLAGCGKKEAKDSWTSIKDKKQVVIGFDNTFVPMGFKDENGKNVGFDIDLANAVFAKYDVKVKMQAIDWDMKETELKNGSIDLIWNGYSATKEREKKVQFTNPYMTNQQVLVTKKSSKIDDVAGMKNKVLGAQQGSSGYDAFTKQTKVLKDSVKDNDATLYDDFNSALLDLKAGRIDGLLIDNVYANYYLTKNGELANYNIITTGYAGENFAVGARKSDKTLVDNINKAFKTLHTDGEFQKISDKWFSKDVYPSK
ncbi:MULTISPECIES: amino acid ABC transporter substrate-binding protein [Pseudolactococcus]|jgi:polar amino acid transport system substrate-binding protein|uniref:Glutamine transport substrate-binding protein n=1 Tax=Pseudolactococcus piscium MKFS47 TaxID=297352 RepID=A0A0D6DUQ1_9LACT|nr:MULTISPECIES: amino acid ABC transporter substrate-binding protein [Lactococcus]MBR6895618.1 amino acid ABC transporter substrate-binding protein [Lactococcus sp.]MCJ1971906.1 amino acid ABC transporter substrate-binding protein [Lactococcus carnosus]MCJ1979822.1 amino acid ABC transporter substrate-binding protein [Lactococcus carnosus]CEN27694.1 Glutamine transport substrate-binding protein [Lactococcus piscium MKFS47]